MALGFRLLFENPAGRQNLRTSQNFLAFDTKCRFERNKQSAVLLGGSWQGGHQGSLQILQLSNGWSKTEIADFVSSSV